MPTTSFADGSNGLIYFDDPRATFDTPDDFDPWGTFQGGNGTFGDPYRFNLGAPNENYPGHQIHVEIVEEPDGTIIDTWRYWHINGWLDGVFTHITTTDGIEGFAMGIHAGF